MNVLAVCSALNNSYIAIKYNNKIYSKIIKSDKNYHSLYIISELKKLIQDNSINLTNIDIITVNCGPGSFTGIRVALSIAKIISGELNKPLVGLNSAEILLSTYNSDIIIMDARRDMFYLGDKNQIKLIYKNQLKEKLKKIKDKKILIDKNTAILYPNGILYEKFEDNIAETMIDIAKEKFINSKDKKEFNCHAIKANYIQTPPIF